MPSPSPHAFRYEPLLCTLSEGQTLADWRRSDAQPKPAKAPLRARVLRRRAGARRLSGR